MSAIHRNIQLIKAKIQYLEKKFQRPRDSVKLLAVSKTRPVECILEAVEGGITAFGENYVQEGIQKILLCQEIKTKIPLEWHFIGPVQSNKTRLVAEYFDWVHTIDRPRIAQRLNEQCPQCKSPLQVLIQVNTSGETSKSGVAMSELFNLLDLLSSLPNLRLRGLMSIPARVIHYKSQLEAFKTLSDLNAEIAKHNSGVDTLSMGTTEDMEASIEAGSSIVRIGTGIFGARN